MTVACLCGKFIFSLADGYLVFLSDVVKDVGTHFFFVGINISLFWCLLHVCKGIYFSLASFVCVRGMVNF